MRALDSSFPHMAMAQAMQVSLCSSPISSRASVHLPPTSLSLNPASVDVSELSALLASTHQNCLQFPDILPNGSVRPAPPSRLRRALENSTVVVSIHIRGRIPGEDYMERADEENEAAEKAPDQNWLWAPFLKRRSRNTSLVAFGRATSDLSLTASIYDLAVAPSLQRRGFGRLVLQRIVRELNQRGICDIAVLTPPELRPFFTACGFSDDALGSTTMLYSRKATHFNTKDSIMPFGRKQLLVPPSIQSYLDTKKKQDLWAGTMCKWKQ